MALSPFLAKPITRETKNRTRKIPKRIFAIEADAAAIPVKPKTPAIKAMIKNVIVQDNIFTPSCFEPFLFLVAYKN